MATAIELSWYSDLKAENDLRRMAVMFDVATIPFSRLDLKESQVNGARLNDAIRHHKVEDYMQGFRNGDTFPRPVVHKTATGYVILSGNQRCEAINRLIKDGDLPKNTAIEAYVVQTDDKLLLEIIARSANAAHGEGDTKEERVQQAVYCCNSLGMATKDAAKAFLIAQNTITTHIRAEGVRKALAKAGVSAQHVPTATLEVLDRLKFDEHAQLNLGTLCAQHLPPSTRAREVAAVCVKSKNAQDRTQVIRDFEKELTAAAHNGNGKHNGNGHTTEQARVPMRPRRDKVISLSSRLVNFLECGKDGEAFTDLEQLQVTTKVDVETVVKQLKKLHYRIGVILK